MHKDLGFWTGTSDWGSDLASSWFQSQGKIINHYPPGIESGTSVGGQWFFLCPTSVARASILQSSHVTNSKPLVWKPEISCVFLVYTHKSKLFSGRIVFNSIPGLLCGYFHIILYRVIAVHSFLCYVQGEGKDSKLRKLSRSGELLVRFPLNAFTGRNEAIAVSELRWVCMLRNSKQRGLRNRKGVWVHVTMEPTVLGELNIVSFCSLIAVCIGSLWTNQSTWFFHSLFPSFYSLTQLFNFQSGWDCSFPWSGTIQWPLPLYFASECLQIEYDLALVWINRIHNVAHICSIYWCAL